jgi:hypothetical protein
MLQLYCGLTKINYHNCAPWQTTHGCVRGCSAVSGRRRANARGFQVRHITEGTDLGDRRRQDEFEIQVFLQDAVHILCDERNQAGISSAAGNECNSL